MFFCLFKSLYFCSPRCCPARKHFTTTDYYVGRVVDCWQVFSCKLLTIIISDWCCQSKSPFQANTELAAALQLLGLGTASNWHSGTTLVVINLTPRDTVLHFTFYISVYITATSFQLVFAHICNLKQSSIQLVHNSQPEAKVSLIKHTINH